jgi:hypothetical protein
MADSGVEEGKPLMAAPFSYGETYFAALLAGIVGFLVVSLVILGILKLVEQRRRTT